MRRTLTKVAMALLLLATAQPALMAAAADPWPRAEATGFCLGVVMSAAQVFGMRPPLFMTRPEADLTIPMPDKRAQALTLAGYAWRGAGVITDEELAAARKAGSASLMRLLEAGGFGDPDYRALRDSCRALGDALRRTDQAATDAAYETAIAQMERAKG
jgi:hypothetical protein